MIFFTGRLLVEVFKDIDLKDIYGLTEVPELSVVDLVIKQIEVAPRQ